MMICIYCMNRLINEDFYHDMAFKSHYKKWGEPDLSFEKIDDVWNKVNIVYTNVRTQKDSDQENREFRRRMEHEKMLQKQDIDYLTKIIKKHIFEWWD
jgi:isocitrate lyase